MQIQFLSDGTEYRSHGGGSFSKNKPGSGLFWWTILITLLMGAAIFCWFFSIILFTHPEKPLHYRLLAKVKKLEPLRKFSPLSVPQGKFLTPRELLAEYFADNAEHLSVSNDQLKRAYIKNYKEQAPKYVKGAFTVVAARELKKTDVFTKGWVVRARADDIEDVDLEMVFPGVDSAPVAYAQGDKITLDQTSTFASAVHVQKLPLDRICVTVLPLAYQGFRVAAVGELQMDAPELLNMDAPWPVACDLDELQGQKVAVKSE
ncbi:MAG: hypothetical protein K1X78_23460 [Verrucomicrobiaceae bacterium]|nr:hypothetical protein [Verrucomicrobiaceae bacterium]